MIRYLARKYIANTPVFTIVLAVIPLLFGREVADTLPDALFWSSAGAAGYTYW